MFKCVARSWHTRKYYCTNLFHYLGFYPHYVLYCTGKFKFHLGIQNPTRIDFQIEGRRSPIEMHRTTKYKYPIRIKHCCCDVVIRCNIHTGGYIRLRYGNPLGNRRLKLLRAPTKDDARARVSTLLVRKVQTYTDGCDLKLEMHFLRFNSYDRTGIRLGVGIPQRRSQADIDRQTRRVRGDERAAVAMILVRLRGWQLDETAYLVVRSLRN